MKLDVEEVQERVAIVEEERAEYNILAADWEALWRMDVWDTTWKDSLTQKGQEQVTLPTTFNTVNLAMRLFSNEPKIEVPACHPSKDSDESASKRERWLKAMWSVVDYQQHRSVVSDLVWQSLVRGRHCVEVKWIKDSLPEKLKEKRFPILIRTLDPMNVGVRHGPMWIEYAFHKYRQPVTLALQRYPNLKRFDSIKGKMRNRKWLEEEIEIVDYWYMGDDGSIWNCVIADQEFVKKPAQTDYPDIPIIEGYGDSAPLPGETFKGLSILHPMKDLYRYQCRLASQLATGVLYYFWPMMVVQNDQGFEPSDFKVQPGQIIQQPQGTKIEQISPQPNVPLAQAVLGQIEGAIQQAGFPSVMYGQAPGDLQAGYGVSLLSDAAKGRVNAVRFNLERTLEQVNMLALGLVEAFAKKPVVVWGKNTRSEEMYNIELEKGDINGYLENRVTITPAIPQDIVQRQTLGLRQVEAGIVSKQSYRNKFLDIPLAEDEAVRVKVEQTLDDDAMRPKVMLEVMQSYYPDDWQRMISGTPLEQVAQAEEQQQQQQQGPPGMPPGMPPMPPGMPPPGMMPPGMGPGGPPMGPPGMAPPMGPGGPMPPGMPIQPPSMNMDAGTFPPELSGQMTPETMGLPPGMDPMMFAQLMGNPLPPGEELNQLQGGI
jgi:hypothetical protein